MPYIMRDAAGRMVGLSMQQTEWACEWVDEGDAELRDFIGAALQRGAPADGDLARGLAESDLQLIRVVEDLVQVLIEKGAIQFIDLPLAARNKLMQRLSLRQSADALKLVGDDHGLI